MTGWDLTARLLGEPPTTKGVGPRWDESMMADPADDPTNARRDELYRLEDRFERLALLTAALAELAMERLGIGEDELAAKVAEIDGRDGTGDGRTGRPAQPVVSDAVPVDRTTCQFCGHRRAQGPSPPSDVTAAAAGGQVSSSTAGEVGTSVQSPSTPMSTKVRMRSGR